MVTITFPRVSHYTPDLAPDSQLKDMLNAQRQQLAAHLPKRPSNQDTKALALWARAKDQILLEIGIIEGQMRNRWRDVPLPGGQQAPMEVAAPARRCATWDHHLGPLKTNAQKMESIQRKACAILLQIRNAQDKDSFIRFTDQLNTLRAHLRRFCARERLELPEFPANLPNTFALKARRAV